MISRYGTAEKAIIVALAGVAAQSRATRPDAQGWTRTRSWEEIKTLHEAGHAVAAYVLGWHVFEMVMDVPDGLYVETGASVEAFASIGPTSDAPFREGPPLTDRRHAASLSFAMAGTWQGARARIRVFRAVADALIDENWAAVWILASELRVHGTLAADRISEILRADLKERGIRER